MEELEKLSYEQLQHILGEALNKYKQGLIDGNALNLIITEYDKRRKARFWES